LLVLDVTGGIDLEGGGRELVVLGNSLHADEHNIVTLVADLEL
jgi:hypothetical protein